MENSLDKALKTVATLALCVIAVQLIPFSKRMRLEHLCTVVNSIEEIPGEKYPSSASSRRLKQY